jgi:hypothetical protein
LANYRTLESIKNQIETDYTNDITVTINPITNNFIDAKPINLRDVTIGDIKSALANC